MADKQDESKSMVAADKRQCSLLIFVATPDEESALTKSVSAHGLPYELVGDPRFEECRWIGTVGSETVIAVGPIRESGILRMGALGPLGSAARAIYYRQATGAQSIVQLGMAFGINRQVQKHGDVLVSSSIIAYDDRDISTHTPNFLRRLLGHPTTHVADYSKTSQQPARASLVGMLTREAGRQKHPFNVHVGVILSGSARIHSSIFRDELVNGVPAGSDVIVGGEMEGVGLLAASTSSDDPVWCVVKGISDFADEHRDREITQSRPLACQNAANFLLGALLNNVPKV
jgi:nucleoside phosphorylase